MSRHLISVKNKTAYINVKDGSYRVEIKPNRNRSLNQNDYYWGTIITYCLEGFKDAGWRISESQVHEELKKMFLKEDVVNELTGEVKTIQRDSKGLSTVEFNEYIEKIQQFAAEFLGVVIPDPGEQITLNLNQP